MKLEKLLFGENVARYRGCPSGRKMMTEDTARPLRCHKTHEETQATKKTNNAEQTSLSACFGGLRQQTHYPLAILFRGTTTASRFVGCSRKMSDCFCWAAQTVTSVKLPRQMNGEVGGACSAMDIADAVEARHHWFFLRRSQSALSRWPAEISTRLEWPVRGENRTLAASGDYENYITCYRAHLFARKPNNITVWSLVHVATNSFSST